MSTRWEAALLAIAHMDAYTRPGEEPAHETMRKLALEALAAQPRSPEQAVGEDTLRQRVEDAEADALRLHNEKMDFFEKWTAAQGEVERLQAALRPFALAIELIECTTDHEELDDDTWPVEDDPLAAVKIGDLRKARAALAASPEPGLDADVLRERAKQHLQRWGQSASDEWLDVLVSFAAMNYHQSPSPWPEPGAGGEWQWKRSPLRKFWTDPLNTRCTYCGAPLAAAPQQGGNNAG